MTENNSSYRTGNKTPQSDPEILRAEDVIPSVPGQQPQGRPDIPEFDLADQILSNHRKLSSVRRKAPGTKSPPSAEQVEQATPAPIAAQPSRDLAEQDRIISRIVAEDIARLCRPNPAS